MSAKCTNFAVAKKNVYNEKNIYFDGIVYCIHEQGLSDFIHRGRNYFI